MLGRRNGNTQGGSKAPDQKQRPRVEALERRALLATITVTNTSDSGAGSLRDAINQVDRGSAAAGSPDTINFGLAGDANVIALQTALPAITRPVIINGPTQSAGNGNPGAPALVIDGSAATKTGGGGVNGLVLQGAGGSQVNNLALVGFADATNGGGRAILVQDGGGDTFAGNYLGLGLNQYGVIDGQTAQANVIGIELRSPNNVIGPGANATATTQGNVISGNSDAGVLIDGAAATGNTVVGNKIGTDKTGRYGVGNLHGIEIQSATGNTIGGTTAANRNTISGNVGTAAALGIGILFTGTASGDVVAGNNIGTDPSGTAYVGNTFGISLGQPVRNNTTDQISNITVGGTTGGAANILSGNGTAIYGTATKSTILGNLIGADATGTQLITLNGARVGNGYGVLLGGSANTIGGTTLAARNIIVGSGTVGTATDNDPFFGTGLDLTGSSFLVQGNLIGLGLGGAALPNNFGVYLNAASSTIGGPAPGAGNVVSANRHNGVTLTGLAGNVVQGNLIGSTTGGVPGNGANGIGLLLFAPDATTAAGVVTLNDTIGGTASGAANLITGNGQNGVAVSSTYAGVAGLAIRGNSITGNGGLGISSGPVLGVPQPSSLTITAATTTGTTSSITGVIGGAPNQGYIIDLYTNAQADPSGTGEGQTYLGSVNAKVGPGGIAVFTASLPVPLAANGVVSATYTPVTSTGVALATSDFSADFPNSTPQANLVLTQQATASVTVGGNVTITATITNTGTGTARGVVFTDALDGTLVNASAATTAGVAFLGPANVVYAPLGDLAPGASARVTITAGTSASATVVNTAGVLSFSPESSYGDNLATQNILVSPAARPTADLAIAITPTSTTPAVGGPLVYVVTVANNGPNAAGNVTVTDFFPPGLFLINSAVSQGGPVTSLGGGAVQANLGTLAPGAFAQILLNVLPVSAGTYTLPVNVASNLLDPVTGNNSASATVTASAVARAAATTSTAATTSGTGGIVTASSVTAATTDATMTVAGVTGSRSNAQLRVAFTAPVSAATATRKANYLLYDLGTTPRALTAADRPIAIASIARDAAGTGVTLTPSRAIRANQYYTLVVVGGTGRGIADASGRKLAGSGGVAGTDFRTTFLAGSLAQA